MQNKGNEEIEPSDDDQIIKELHILAEGYSDLTQFFGEKKIDVENGSIICMLYIWDIKKHFEISNEDFTNMLKYSSKILGILYDHEIIKGRKVKQ